MKKLTVISNRNEFDSFREKASNSVIWIYPILSDTNTHPAANRPSALIAFIGNNAYLLAFHHSEAPPLPIEWITEIKGNFVIVPDKKDWLYFGTDSNSIYDTQMYEYLMFGSVSSWEIPQVCSEMKSRYRNYHNTADAMPIMKLLEEAENWARHSLRYMTGFQEHLITPYYKNLPSVLHFIESPGIKIDESEFLQYFSKSEKHIHNGLIYSQYHPYHITGRPSNAFGDINFAAIPKKDGSRKSFVSRFGKDGKLVLIDFESFHLRLIANTIGWTQPTEPFHTYLAKEYYKKSDITQEEYEDGKRITFKNLYSDEREISTIPFFQKVYSFVDDLWDKSTKIGSFETFFTKRLISLSSIDLPTKAKIFNYYIQSMESEVALGLINRLRPIYEGMESKVVLYTYDSILVDFCKEDGSQLLADTINVLENGQVNVKLPTRIFYGDNYHEMKKMGE